MKSRFHEILEEQAAEWGVTIEEIEGKSRAGALPVVRAKIIHQYKKEFPYSTWRDIGRWLNMDHSSVIPAFHKVEDGTYESLIKAKDFSRS